MSDNSYDSVITSKGTITLAAPLRKSLGLKPGQRVTLRLNDQHQIVVDAGTNMAEFEALRADIAAKVPRHLRGLSGDDLREAAANAWTEKYRTGYKDGRGK